MSDVLVPYSTTFDVQRQPMPYFDAYGMRLPDVYDDRAMHVRHRPLPCCISAHGRRHRRWSTPIFADNFSPAQRLAIECFEDARMDTLMTLREYPGMRRILLALHPTPIEGACNPATHSLPAPPVDAAIARADGSAPSASSRHNWQTGCGAFTPCWRKAKPIRL
jgi:nitric oxide reductase NorD protein